MTRLCYGEIDWPTGDSGTAYLRNIFLERIAEVAGEVLQDLHTTPFEFYMDQSQTLGADWDRLITFWNRTDRRCPDFNRNIFLRHTLEDWARRWNLNATWILDAAHRTLREWLLSPPAPGLLAFAGLGWGGSMLEPLSPPEGLPRYQPIWHRRSGYLANVRQNAYEKISADPLLALASKPVKDRLVDSVVQKASEYCEENEQQYIERGFIKGEGYTRVQGTEMFNRHLSWTVKYQVLSQPYGEVAPEVAASTVQRAVDSILLLVGLEKRASAKPGRRPGSKGKASKIQKRLGRK